MEPRVRDFRPRAAQWLAATGAVALMPFVVFDLADGDGSLAFGLLLMSAALALGVWLLAHDRYSPILVVVVFAAPAVAVNTVAMLRFGVFVTFWTFVIVMAVYLVLPLRWALVVSALTMLITSPVSWAQYGFGVGSRFSVCVGLVAVFSAVSVRLVDDRERLLIEQMATDPLTGLLNRTTLMSRLSAAAAAPASAVLLTLDIDHFKLINDRFGHEAGDRVLVGFAALTRTHLRAGAPVFRLGGEEFLVIVEGAARAEGEAIGHRLLRGVESHDFLGGHTVTVSIGVAERLPGEAVGDWLRRADQALYRAKDAGRNRLVAA